MAYSSPLVFPSVNDLGAGTTGNGIKLKEAQLAGKWAKAMGASHNYTVSGAAASAPGSGRVLTMPTGTHFIAGYFVDTNASDTLTIDASSTRYVYLALTRDGNGNVASISLGQTGTYSSAANTADRVLLGKAVTDASNITSYTDLRRSRLWRPTVRVARTTNVSVANSSTPGTVTWEDGSINTDNMWDSGTGSQIVIQSPGLYLPGGVAKWNADAGAAGLRITAIELNGTTELARHQISVGTTQIMSMPFPSKLLELDAGDVIRAKVAQTSGASLDIDGGVHDTFFHLTFVGHSWESVTL